MNYLIDLFKLIFFIFCNWLNPLGFIKQSKKSSIISVYCMNSDDKIFIFNNQ